MPHAQNSARGFSANRKRFGQNIFQSLSALKSFAKFFRRRGKFIVRVILKSRLQRVDFIDRLLQAFDFLVVVVAQKSFQESEQVYHSPKFFIMIAKKILNRKLFKRGKKI